MTLAMAQSINHKLICLGELEHVPGVIESMQHRVGNSWAATHVVLPGRAPTRAAFIDPDLGVVVAQHAT